MIILKMIMTMTVMVMEPKPLQKNPIIPKIKVQTREKEKSLNPPKEIMIHKNLNPPKKIIIHKNPNPPKAIMIKESLPKEIIIIMYRICHLRSLNRVQRRNRQN